MDDGHSSWGWARSPGRALSLSGWLEGLGWHWTQEGGARSPHGWSRRAVRWGPPSERRGNALLSAPAESVGHLREGRRRGGRPHTSPPPVQTTASENFKPDPASWNPVAAVLTRRQASHVAAGRVRHSLISNQHPRHTVQAWPVPWSSQGTCSPAHLPRPVSLSHSCSECEPGPLLTTLPKNGASFLLILFLITFLKT